MACMNYFFSWRYLLLLLYIIYLFIHLFLIWWHLQGLFYKLTLNLISSKNLLKIILKVFQCFIPSNLTRVISIYHNKLLVLYYVFVSSFLFSLFIFIIILIIICFSFLKGIKFYVSFFAMHFIICTSYQQNAIHAF